MSLITLPEKWGVRFCFWMLIILVIKGFKPKDPDPQIVIDTGELSEIGPTHCIIEGEILETGVNEILQHGFVWSESPDVTLGSGKKNELGVSGPGTYSYYDNSTDNQDTYGMLYTWAAAMNGEGSSNELPSGIQGVCPSGWHMPSESEWKELEYQLGMSELIAVDVGWRGYEEGGMLKQKGTNLWKEPNLMATNETGFTALPGGFRDADGLFRAIESFTAFWSSTANEEGAWLRGLHYDRGEILHEPYPVKYGLSVRCVKDR
jgi:uncharacterized protein (TIGR02145 family)